jgi:hypothetical protein
MSPIKSLGAEELCQRCNPEQFDFETTADLPELKEIIGQARAVEAVNFAIGIRRMEQVNNPSLHNSSKMQPQRNRFPWIGAM